MSKLAHSTGWSVYRRQDGVSVVLDDAEPARGMVLLASGLLYTDALDRGLAEAESAQQLPLGNRDRRGLERSAWWLRYFGGRS